MNGDDRLFFEDLKRMYSSENRDIHWGWEELESNSNLDGILSYLAYTLSKSIIHGPLPDSLHNRMVLGSGNEWRKAYSEYMKGPEIGR